MAESPLGLAQATSLFFLGSRLIGCRADWYLPDDRYRSARVPGTDMRMARTIVRSRKNEGYSALNGSCNGLGVNSFLLRHA